MSRMPLAAALVSALIVPIAAAQHQITYVCTSADGQKSIQDEPCPTGDASRHIPTATNLPTAPTFKRRGTATQARPKRRSRPGATRNGNSKRGWSKQDAARCRDLYHRKLALEARSRAGYRAREGEHIRRALRRIEDNLKANCRNKVPQRYWTRGRDSPLPP